MSNFIAFTRALLALAIIVVIGQNQLYADSVSFFVNPTTLPDSNGDGFVNENDFQPVGTDGTIFSLVPTDNLTGPDRFMLSETNGLQYGGGGGSTVAFNFSVNRVISLESYTLGEGFFLSNPSFSILDSATVISSTNTSNNAGDTHNFNSGPLELTAGTVYSFETQINGAAVQAFLGSWTYTAAVPEPTSFLFLTVSSMAMLFRRNR